MSSRRFAVLLAGANAAVLLVALTYFMSGPTDRVTFGQTPPRTTVGPGVLLLPVLLLALNGGALIAHRRRRR
jgi:hypothetical protein